LGKQLNVMQTIPTVRSHPHLKRAAHHTQHIGVTKKSNAECKVYVTVLF